MDAGITLLLAVALSTLGAGTGSQAHARLELTFPTGRPFKIVQFTDTQDDEQMDPRTVAGMRLILDRERPDLVIITGDVLSAGECDNLDEIRSAIRQVVQPMEERRIPWVVTMGNHDYDDIDQLGITGAQMMDIYRSYPHNLNPLDPVGVHGAGNGLLEVRGSDGRAALGIWLIDSLAYAPEEIAGQKLGSYDWIRSTQVAWYVRRSVEAEHKLGHKLPGLMFFHIPLPEFGQMWAAGLAQGERNEVECPSPINSGMFAAILDRGDVMGVYVGHDHINTYEGTWYGIRLGYAGNIGFGTYGLKGDEVERNRLRGARVFEIRQEDPRKYESRYLLLTDLR